MLDLESKLVGADSIESAIKACLQGVPGGWHESNQLLSIAGGHANRTTQVFYAEDEDEPVDNYVAGLEVDRLASQMDIICNEYEVVAGIIMFMKAGLFLGHWKKFHFNDDYKPRTYIGIWKAQYEFEHGGMGSLAPQEIEPKTRRFNEFHRELNRKIEEVYGGLQTKVDEAFDELFLFLVHNCGMKNEEYQKLSENRLQLLHIRNEDNPMQKLVKRLCENAPDPREAWLTYQNYKKGISLIGVPEKRYLYEVFNSNKDRQDRYQMKFINHLKSSFGDDFIKIMSKLDLEVQ